MKNIAKINWRVSVALLLAALMSLTLVVACGGNASSGDVADSGEPDATADTTAPSAPATSEDTEPLTTGERFVQVISETEGEIRFSLEDLLDIVDAGGTLSIIGPDGFPVEVRIIKEASFTSTSSRESPSQGAELLLEVAITGKKLVPATAIQPEELANVDEILVVAVGRLDDKTATPTPFTPVEAVIKVVSNVEGDETEIEIGVEDLVAIAETGRFHAIGIEGVFLSEIEFTATSTRRISN